MLLDGEDGLVKGRLSGCESGGSGECSGDVGDIVCVLLEWGQRRLEFGKENGEG